MQCITMTWTRYHTHYYKFSLRFAWFSAICNRLPRVTVIFLKKVMYIYFFIDLKVTRGNPLQIAQNQANLRENVR